MQKNDGVTGDEKTEEKLYYIEQYQYLHLIYKQRYSASKPEISEARCSLKLNNNKTNSIINTLGGFISFYKDALQFTICLMTSE